MSSGFLITCPACAARYDLDLVFEEDMARRFFGLLADCPSDFVGPFIRYLRLHKPAKSALKWAKCHKIANDLVPMVKAARVERNGVTKAAPVELWVSCIEQLLNDPPANMQLPLKGNGYLLSIVAAHAERQLATAEEKREQERKRVSPTARTEARQQEGLQQLSETMRKHFGEGNDQ